MESPPKRQCRALCLSTHSSYFFIFFLSVVRPAVSPVSTFLLAPPSPSVRPAASTVVAAAAAELPPPTGAVAAGPDAAAAAWGAVLRVNEALMHRAVLRRPMSLLKYAMTLDGKIATRKGHSAWVTSPPARALVFEQRARSDAVIVGGNTVRRDNPRLTTRRDGGHAPVRAFARVLLWA
eukprot:352280-Chlamydomonas_euryale.AAC.2